jgi:hypothetical protein
MHSISLASADIIEFQTAEAISLLDLSSVRITDIVIRGKIKKTS